MFKLHRDIGAIFFAEKMVPKIAVNISQYILCFDQGQRTKEKENKNL